MIKLTEQQIVDYLYCPAKYDMKYNKGMDFPDYVNLKMAVMIVAKYFCTHLMNNKILTPGELKKKWDIVCNQYIDFFKADPKRSLMGMSYLTAMYEYFKQNKINVIDVDTSYFLKIGNVELTGCMGGPIVGPDIKTPKEILYLDFGSKRQSQMTLDMKLKYSLDALAYKVSLQRDLNGMRIFYAKNKVISVTTRNKHDFNRIITTVSNVGKAIENNIYFPRENVLCDNCPANKYCRFWYCK